MRSQPLVARILIALVIALIVYPVLSSPLALCAGLVIALTTGNPWAEATKKAVPRVLSNSLVALGAGMNLYAVATVGLHGFSYTLLSISGTLLLGLALKRLFKADYETSLLITVGTAICGGSAIAAVAPTINAKSSTISMALAVVFLLNSVALFLFPPLGHAFGFDQNQFGLWAALAIHDTSSVVGSTMQYGPEALAVGTTVKLARALWIIPVTLLISWLHQRGETAPSGSRKIAKKPWFILGFLLSAALFTFLTPRFPALKPLQDAIEFVGRRGMVLTLFLIGLNINVKSLKELGPKPIALGIVLWLMVLSLSAAGVYIKFIQ